MATNTSPMMMHSTYFSLKQGSSADTRASYMAACREYLSTSQGMLSFWVGELAEDMTRPVNDRNFNVAMNQVFQNKGMFDLYNGHDPRHDQFVAEVNRWAAGTTRRVLDSYLSRLGYVGAPSSGIPASGIPAGGASLPPRLMHSIYFSLTDKSEKSRAKFTGICLKYLSDHPGVSVFAIGELADMKRDVSVTNYDVAMNILWEGKKYYDSYLKSQSHDDFFPATKGMIADTYVFDSYLLAEPAAPVTK